MNLEQNSCSNFVQQVQRSMFLLKRLPEASWHKAHSLLMVLHPWNLTYPKWYVSFFKVSPFKHVHIGYLQYVKVHGVSIFFSNGNLRILEASTVLMLKRALEKLKMGSWNSVTKKESSFIKDTTSTLWGYIYICICSMTMTAIHMYIYIYMYNIDM